MSPSSPALPHIRSWRPWGLALLAVLSAHAWMLGPPPAEPVRAPPAMQAWLRLEPARAAPVLPAAKPAAARRPSKATLPASSSPSMPAPSLSVAPSLAWDYRLRLNGRDGRARLSWQLDEDGAYRLQLDRWLGDRSLPAWRSTGRVSPEGLAPSRYAELRGEREARATNFRREEGLISYSASSELVPLVDAAQDPISWWLQLAALAAAQAPQPPGREIHLPVAGLRGEPSEWVFELIDVEQGLLHLRRPAAAEWDGTLDVWLDPARHHLPVRLQNGDPETRGWALEFAHPASTE